MKAVLIRVGIDSGRGGDVGPIFEDGLFEYVPIDQPKEEKTTETRRYNNTKGRSGKYYSYFVAEKFRNEIIHFDPEFTTFTYGDHLKKSKIFSKLNQGDFLIFYVGLKPYEANSQFRGLYIIGYFLVDNVYTYPDFNKKEIRDKLKNNAHMKMKEIKKDTVIVAGNPVGSKLLKKAIGISRTGKDHYISSDNFSKMIGKPKGYSLLRSSPRVIEGKYAKSLVEYILNN